MSETPPPPSSGSDPGPNPYGGQPTPPPPPTNPYSSQPPPPADPYSSQPPPPADPYAGNPPAAGQTPYGATPFPTTPGGPAPVAGSQPGGLGVRFVARLIDSIVIGIIAIIIGAITVNWVGSLIGAILYLVYFTFMESSRGQTIGKMVMRLHTQDASGGLPTMQEAFRRNAWYLIGVVAALPLGIISVLLDLISLGVVIYIAVTINSDPQKRGWHDKFANTAVTRS